MRRKIFKRSAERLRKRNARLNYKEQKYKKKLAGYDDKKARQRALLDKVVNIGETFVQSKIQPQEELPQTRELPLQDEKFLNLMGKEEAKKQKIMIAIISGAVAVVSIIIAVVLGKKKKRRR
jgi:hypothetical protein